MPRASTIENFTVSRAGYALIALGCVRQQGHLYAKAMPAEQFEAYLAARQAEGYAADQQQQSDWTLDGLS